MPARTLLNKCFMTSERRHLRLTRVTLAACLVTVGGLVGCTSDRAGGPTSGSDDHEISVGDGPCCIAASADRLWVLNRRAETLQSIDPATLSASEPYAVGARQMIPVGDKLFLADTHDAVLSIFDPETLRQIPIRDFDGRGAAVMAGRHLLLGSPTNGELVKIDLADGSILQRVTIPDVPSYDSMVLSNGLLWTTTWEGELLRIDLKRRIVVSRHMPFPEPEDYVGIAAGTGDRILAVSGGAEELVVLDSITADVVARRPIELTGNVGVPVLVPQPDGTLLLARGPDVIDVLDPHSGRTLSTHRLPEGTDPQAGERFFGGAATGFGSLWVGIWSDLDKDGSVIRLPL